MIILGVLLLLHFSACLQISELSSSKSNSRSVSDYTMVIVPEVEILTTATIRVQFPSIYDVSSVPLHNSSFTLVNTSTLSLQLPTLLKDISYTLVMPQITNPVHVGSSGLFSVYTFKGSLLVEQNLTARMVGLADVEVPIVNPNIYLDSTSQPTAGEIAYYNFIFTMNVSVPYAVSIWLIMPTEFVVPAQPSCSTFGINQQSNNTVLSCYSSSGVNAIIVKQYSAQPLSNGSRLAIKVSLLNPNRTGTTGNFSVLVYKSSTSYLVSSYYNVPGVVIQQGNIYSASFTPYNPYAVQSKNKIMDYLLRFTPKNPLSANNSIVIDLPTGFTVLSGSGYDYVRVTQGISGGTLTWNSSQILLTNVTVLGSIQIIMRLQNPPTAGGTNQLLLSTYDRGVLVDQNNLLSTIIQAIDSDDVRVYSTFDVGFLPLTNYSRATLVVSNLQVNSPQCLLNAIAINCYSLNGQVFFGNGNITLTAYQLNTLSITNLNYYPGTYLLDVYVKDNANSQSSSAVVVLPSNSFASAAVQIIDAEYSVPPNYNRSSILNITFITDYQIAGSIRIWFQCSTICTNYLLGAVVKPVRGLAAVSSESLSIVMTDNQTYEISNFVIISESTFVEIHVAGLINPIDNGAITVTVTNELSTTLSLIVFDSFTASYSYGTLPGMEYGYSAVAFNLSSGSVDSEFTLTFPPMLNDDQFNVHLIIQLPGYDTMLLRQKNTVACQIDGTFYECITYPDIDWVMIKDIPALYMTNPTTGLKPVVTLYGLQWPTYSDSVGYITWRAIDTTTLIEKDRKTLGNIIGNSTFTAPNATSFVWGRLALSNTATGAPGVTMYFTFQTSTLLPNGSVILLTLPPEFSLNTSNPVPGVDAPMFSDASASLPLIISIGLTTVTFTNVAAVPQLSTFSITISGVQMPHISPLPNSTNNFSLKVTKNGKPVTSISNFDTLYYSSAFTADSMAALLVVGKPVTGLACLYTFRLEPVHSIPKFGIIQILFPFNATFLSCGVIGAITEFSSCSVGSDNRTITITLTESYYTGVFNITLQEVVNPTTAGSYSFVVNSLYDGVMMDSVTVTTRLYTIADSVGVSIAAVPTSQGEWGVYNLSVTLTQPSDTIMVSFSSSFSPEAQQISSKGQFVAGTYYIGFGSVNPSSFRTNTIYVLSWLHGNAVEKGSANFTSSPSPNWLQLNSYLINDSMVGRPTTITIFAVVPLLESIANTGRLEIEFDQRFDCTYAQLLNSSASLLMNATASTISLQSVVSLSGSIWFNFSLLNPNVSGTYSLSMRSRTSASILSRTFPNMDYLDLPIKDVGPVFWVNNNQTLLVYENTISGNYVIQTSYPSRYSVRVQSVVLGQGITVVPASIEIGLYSRNASFRIVASSATPGIYMLKWIIQLAEYSSFYNPIVQSTIEVLACPVMNIFVQPINLVPVSGTTLPLRLSLPFAPTVPLQITLTPTATDPFVYSSTVLVFVNTTSVWFSINSTLSQNSSSFFQGTIFTLASNHSNYTLSANQFSVISLPYDNQPPFVSELNLIQQQRDHVIISIGTSELSLVQVIVQHWYDSPPEVINHKLTLVNSPQILVNESVNLTASVLQNLTISGLSSGTHYIVYCMAVDRGGNDSPIRSLEIVTVSHLPALEVLYPFSQPNITSHQRDSILIPRLAFYLSIPIQYLINPYTSALYTSQSAGQYIQNVFYQPLWIVINDSYTSAEMLQELQGSLNYIQQFLPHTSTTTSVSSTQTSWKIPNVVNVSASQTIGELTVNVVLDYFGTIYVSAYQRQLNYTYQIQELANCTGLLVNSFNFSCTFPVEPSTSYIVHVTVGDIGPLFSTLSTQFTTLQISTLPAKQVYHLDINHQPTVGSLLLTVLLVCALVTL